jgi:solute carrier family 35 protein E3
MLLLVVGPAVDYAVSRQWVTQYEFSGAAAACLALSCAIAVLVNISQFMCLGRFSALTFQVGGSCVKAPYFYHLGALGR